MLDINLLREKPELVKASEKKRGRDPKIVDEVLKKDEAWKKELSSVCGAGYGLPPFKLFELPSVDSSERKYYVFYSDDYYGPMNQDWTKPSAGFGYSASFYQLILPGCKRQGGYTYSRGGVRYGGNYNSVFLHGNQYYFLKLYKENNG